MNGRREMANIFDGMENTKDDDIRFLIASLEEVNVKNVGSEMGQKAYRGVIKGFNALKKFVGDSAPVSEPEVVSMEERIATKKTSLDSFDKNELLKRLRSNLIKKLPASYDDASSIDTMSDDMLSAKVIDAAAKAFKKEIEEGLTPAQKADAIYHRYNERLLAQTRKVYNDATKEQIEKLEKQLDDDIANMSAEQMQELQKALGVDKITGSTLSSMIKTTAGTTTLMLALDASGFGAYIALTTIMHAIFTTILGVTVPFAAYTTATSTLAFITGPIGWIALIGVEAVLINRSKNKMNYELLSQTVWLSVLGYGGKFTPVKESLPSWLPEEAFAREKAESKELIELVKSNNNLKAECESKTNALSKVNAELVSIRKQQEEDYAKSNEIRRQLELEKNNTQTLIKNLQVAGNKLDNIRIKVKQQDEENEVLRSEREAAEKEYKKAEKKLEQNKDDIIAFDEILKLMAQDNEEYQHQMVDKNNKIEELESETEKLKDQLERKTKIEDTKSDKKATDLEQRWGKTYKRFEFAKGVIKEVVKKYEYQEYGDLESVLMQIHEAKDPAAISCNRGKIKKMGCYHAGVSTCTGFPSRIFYKPIQNNSNGKMVRIEVICKHSDPRYAKWS